MQEVITHRTEVDYCRNCHERISFVLAVGSAGFTCPLCKCVHDLSGHSIAVIHNKKVLEPGAARTVKAKAAAMFKREATS